jgi:GntR family transcriptional regulator, transcriptional repressor for pyruvate dehydrogenase complex
MTMSDDQITFAPTPRRKLTDTVTRQLLDAVRGRAPGTRLPSERELVEQLGVGRSTVREALKGLALIGVVEIRHGQGVFVATHDAAVPGVVNVQTAEAGALREARDLLEPEIARLAALRRTPADLAALEAVLAAHRAHVEAGTPPLIETSRFHILLAEAAHNGVLLAVVRPFFRLMAEQGPHFYEVEPGFAAWELGEHAAILDAVREGDGELARERAATHVSAMDRHYDADATAVQA